MPETPAPRAAGATGAATDQHPAAGPAPSDRATEAQVAAAVAALRRGELVAFPTETVYGLGADAADPAAVARVFAAKGRPADHPLIVHLASAAQLDDWAVDVPEVARRLADRFWPGPLTLILRRHPRVPTAVTGGQDTIGVRVPRHPVAHALLEAFGGGVAAPSANRFGRVSPTTRERVVAELGDVVGTILEGGDCEVGLESTIVDLSGDRPRLLRPGGIGTDELAEVLDAVPTREGTGAPRTPGRLPSHYAPTTPVRVVDADALDAAVAGEREAGRRVAVLRVAGDGDGDIGLHGAETLTLPAEPAAYGRALYGRLAEIDRLGCDVAVVERPPARHGWEAVHDRLGRAQGVDPHALRAVLLVGPCADEGPPDTAGAVEELRAWRATAEAVPVLLLGAWASSAYPPEVLPAVRGDRAIHTGLRLTGGPGWALVALEASDANLGIPVGRVELALALHDTGRGRFHLSADDALAADTRALQRRGVVGTPLAP
ncbi:L-threonylcarbamoyladenylate synthase [Actinotalea sp. Marseille-Q4924]|uniref:L-threonylcarbamoyladenylate synthase n=1 Tax=Actinotalea sp. Marseille-Q4924 TaxID=2866571 RepID=UPI001CE405E2|nr:L-threonylcarbamoyladenylate synthase [Actinotalea sp. Marseille-Q4924]